MPVYHPINEGGNAGVAGAGAIGLIASIEPLYEGLTPPCHFLLRLSFWATIPNQGLFGVFEPETHVHSNVPITTLVDVPLKVWFDTVDTAAGSFVLHFRTSTAAQRAGVPKYSGRVNCKRWTPRAGNTTTPEILQLASRGGRLDGHDHNHNVIKWTRVGPDCLQ